jgi:PAS domain S-box-containing protein
MELNERKFVLPDGGAGIICMAEDITERAKAEENLKNSEESYRGLFNSTRDAIYIQDRNGHFVDVNDGAVKMYGYPRKYFLGKTPEFLSAPGMNDLNKAVEMIRNAFQGKPQSFEFWGIDRNGRIFPKEIRLNKGRYFDKDVVIAFAQDITERKAAQKTLQESEKKYRKIFNAFPDIYFRSDLNGIIEEISPSIKRISGYFPEEVIGKDSRKFYFDRSDWDKIGGLLQTVDKVDDFDTRIQIKGNKFINCSLTAILIYGEDGKPYGVEGVLRDITDRKKSEETLMESQRRLSTLMGNLPGMAYRCQNDKDWTMEFVSDGCLELTGYTSSDLIGNKTVSYNNLIHPEDRSMVWDNVQEGVSRHNPFRMIYRINTKNDNLKWVWEQGIGIYSNDGNLIALEGFISNITDQKLAEEEIRKFSRSVEQSPTIVVITSLNGSIEYINPKFTRVTGYLPEEVLHKNPRILKSGKTPKETYTTLWQTITSGKEWSGEFINKKKNGDIYWESANVFPLKDEKGKITHFIAMKEDITARKAMEQDLIRAKEKAEESDKLKSAFLANMSHEIRTPMNAIIGFSQLLSETDITPDEQIHYISLIQKSGSDLLGLIDDIIDISKIEAGQLKIFKSDYFVDAILTEIYESYIEYLKTTETKKDIKFRYNRSSKLKKVVIYTDIDKLKQAVRNLINNAIKFTDFGLIEFGAEIMNNGKSSSIRFYVRDTGIGIPDDKQDVIFESFRQLDVTNKRLYGGTGLGLAITRKIVELLGGDIGVKSTPGQGSTFYFNLPYNPLLVQGDNLIIKPETADLKEYNWENKHLLIVEDDEQSFFFYQSVLRKTNIQITRATDGIEAIDYCTKQKFDLILMDIRMPRMDGYITSEKILAINPDAKIIAQTAYALAGERQRCLDSGCVDYISKPIKITEFLRMIEKNISSK